MPAVAGIQPSPYSDTPEPKCFATVSPLDPQFFPPSPNTSVTCSPATPTPSTLPSKRPNGLKTSQPHRAARSPKRASRQPRPLRLPSAALKPTYLSRWVWDGSLRPDCGAVYCFRSSLRLPMRTPAPLRLSTISVPASNGLTWHSRCQGLPRRYCLRQRRYAPRPLERPAPRHRQRH